MTNWTEHEIQCGGFANRSRQFLDALTKSLSERFGPEQKGEMGCIAEVRFPTPIRLTFQAHPEREGMCEGDIESEINEYIEAWLTGWDALASISDADGPF